MCAALWYRESRLGGEATRTFSGRAPWECVRTEEREGYGPRLVIAEVQVIHRIPRRQRSPYTVFTPVRLWATTSARGHLVPLKEHIKPHRTHTTSPAGRRAHGPHDSYLHFSLGGQRNRHSPHVDYESVRGVVMAARAGEIWEGGTKGRQGCPGCCKREWGWGWSQQADGTYAWRSAGGRTPQQADMYHALCGECEGVPQAERQAGRAEMRGGLQQALKILTRKGRRNAPQVIGEGRQEVVQLVHGALRMMAKG